MMLALTLTHGAGFGVTPGPMSVPSTVVRADRQGRLVRTVTVPANVVRAKLVSVQEVKPGQPGADPKVTTVAELDAMIGEKSREHGVDPLLVHSIIHVESRYNPYALSHKGAEGLMQLMPQTARSLGVRSGFDVRQNVSGGVKYLKQMLEKFDDLRLALAAYNAGPEAVVRWNGIPPYAETQDYVYKVGKRYGELRRQHNSSQVALTPVIQAEESEPEFRPLEARVDDEGRLHLKTR